MITFKCKMCGGDLTFEPGASVAECPYCGTNQTLPKLDDDKRANLYDRANHFRRQNEFDKAMAIYEQVLAEDRTDAEAYWSLVLCRYGIEYVEDPASHKRVPTVNRVQYASILADEDYKSALAHADAAQRRVYEAEANAIAEIQKGILDISRKEAPFDVFICYKETDANGCRTPDSVLANDMYHQLTKEGFKVFFSRITLEDKIGTAYEPYIFAALNSAKVMVVLGTKPEYFGAVWVKNEWSRYLALIRNGADKTLVPAYRDMDPYDLPEEFAHLQAQDMGKLGFMQDLIRGIKKILQKDEMKPAAMQESTVRSVVAGAAPLVKRAFMSLEDGDFAKADDFCEQALNLDPENARAWVGKLMAQLNVRKEGDLKNQSQPFDDNSHYQKVMRYGDEALKKQLRDSIIYINNRNEHVRQQGVFDQADKLLQQAKTSQQCFEAKKQFQTISSFEGVQHKLIECDEKVESINKANYERASAYQNEGNWDQAIWIYEKMEYYRDSKQQLQKCHGGKEAEKRAREEQWKQERIIAEKKKKAEATKRRTLFVIACLLIVAVAAGMFVYIKVIKPIIVYNNGMTAMNEGDYNKAAVAFERLDNYKDATVQAKECRYQQGSILLTQGNQYNALFAFRKAGKDYKETSKYLEVLESVLTQNSSRIIASSSSTIGLKDNGTVIAVGDNEFGQCNTNSWRDIIAVSAGESHTVGLKSDGTVVAVGDNEYGQLNVKSWQDIVAISAGASHTVGLKSDGSVVAAGRNDGTPFNWDGVIETGQCNTGSWKDVVAITTGPFRTVGLKANGTVVAVGENIHGECNTGNWENIVTVSAGFSHTVGLKADGTVVAVGENHDGRCDTNEWQDIVAVSAGDDHTIGLKADGTVIAVGNNEYGQCNTNNWDNIIAAIAGRSFTIGLKANGTVVTVGGNNQVHCDTKEWEDIIAVSTDDYYIVGLKADGSVVATGGKYYDAQCEVGDWNLFDNTL